MDEEMILLKQRVEFLEHQLLEMKDKYIQLLESKLANGNEKSEVPIKNSERTGESTITDLQLLFLLKESKAINKQYAVTASQLCAAYSLNRCDKTIRNKLNDLELRNFVSSIGLKPKAFFVTPTGLAALERQQRSSITVKPF